MSRSFGLIAALAALLFTSAAVAATTARIIGTPHDDTIVGTAHSDAIAALAGNDRVNALTGDDSVQAGPGDDVVFLNVREPRDRAINCEIVNRIVPSPEDEAEDNG